MDNTGSCLPNIGRVAALQGAPVLDFLVFDCEFMQHYRVAKSGTL